MTDNFKCIIYLAYSLRVFIVSVRVCVFVRVRACFESSNFSEFLELFPDYR